MPYSGPGLPYKPDDARLVAFDSLAPADDHPGLAGRVLRGVGRLATLPFRLLGALIRLPLRLTGRRHEAAPTRSQTSEKD